MIRITNVVKQLIILNAIVFVILSFSPPQYKEMLCLFFPTSPEFRFWQPLSHMFNHANISHIFFNMFGLFMFGSLLESVWGEGKFLRFYLLCGIGAFVAQWIFWYFTSDYLGMVRMLGASGAVSGCLIGVAMLAPNMTVMLLIPPIPIKMKYLALLYFVIDLFMGFGQVGNVANFAHIGGALTGLAICYYWKTKGLLHQRGHN